MSEIFSINNNDNFYEIHKICALKRENKLRAIEVVESAL